MNPIKKKFLLIFSLTLSLLASCREKMKEAMLVNDTQDSLAVFRLSQQQIIKQVILPAELTPYERTEIFAKVPGYVNQVNGDMGDVISKGQVLALLEAPEMLAASAQIAAELLSAESKYMTSKDAYQRLMRAAQQEGTVAAGELERLKNQVLTDSSLVESTKARNAVQDRLKEYLVVRAPFGGRLIQRNIDQGALVGQGNTKPLFVLENNRFLRLRVPVPEAMVSAVPEAGRISFGVDALPGKSFEAKLTRKAGALNQTNRTETWEFLYDNQGGHLKSGMFARVSMQLKRPEATFVVPASAVFTSNERRFVIRVREGMSEWMDVRLGVSLERGAEIFGPLMTGDTLLMRASDEIKPGRAIVTKF